MRMTADHFFADALNDIIDRKKTFFCCDLALYHNLKGIEGLQKIQEIMETLRNETPSEIAGYKVLSARDYKKDTIKNMESGEMTKTGLPSSNVLYYDLSDEAWLCVRPSGTEPKVKFYYGVKGTSLEDADAKSAALGKQVVAMIQEML